MRLSVPRDDGDGESTTDDQSNADGDSDKVEKLEKVVGKFNELARQLAVPQDDSSSPEISVDSKKPSLKRRLPEKFSKSVATELEVRSESIKSPRRTNSNVDVVPKPAESPTPIDTFRRREPDTKGSKGEVNIVIFGGGVVGVLVAKGLAKAKCGNITLVDPKTSFQLPSALIGVPFENDLQKVAQICKDGTVNYSTALPPEVTVIQSSVNRLRMNDAVLQDGTISFDIAIICTGHSWAPTFPSTTLPADVTKLKENILGFGPADATWLQLNNAKRVAVIGAGFVGTLMASWMKTAAPKLKISLVTKSGKVLDDLYSIQEDSRIAVTNWLDSKKISRLSNDTLGAGDAQITVGGRAFNKAFWCIPTPNGQFLQKHFNGLLTADGYIRVNECFQGKYSNGEIQEHIFAGGDVVQIDGQPKEERVLENVLKHAKHLVSNVQLYIKRKSLKPYKVANSVPSLAITLGPEYTVMTKHGWFHSDSPKCLKIQHSFDKYILKKVSKVPKKIFKSPPVIREPKVHPLEWRILVIADIQFGTRLAHHLLQDGYSIRVARASAAAVAEFKKYPNAETCVYQLDEPMSLRKMFQGIDIAFINFDIGVQIVQHYTAALEALNKSNVKFVVEAHSMSGVSMSEFQDKANAEILKIIQQGKQDWCVLQFEATIDQSVNLVVKDIKQLRYVGVPNMKRIFVDSNDLVEIATSVMLNPTKHKSKTYFFANPTISYLELVALIEKEVGEEMRFNTISVDDWIAYCTKIGRSTEFIKLVLRHFFTYTPPTAKTDWDVFLDRPPTNYVDWIRKNIHLFV